MCYTQVLGSKAGQKLGGVTLLQEHSVLGVILLLQSVTAFYSYLFIAVYASHTICTASLVAIGIKHSRLSLSFVFRIFLKYVLMRFLVRGQVNSRAFPSYINSIPSSISVDWKINIISKMKLHGILATLGCSKNLWNALFLFQPQGSQHSSALIFQKAI